MLGLVRTAAAVIAVVAVALTVGATPASAHAILLRTDPAPQTTVARPPTSVHLFFSEAVEVTFGAVRVFNVDGKRVDRGSIRRASANREVVVATPGLKPGTYTVTWRAVSGDGHAVHGGFTFYAVNPSSISAVAVSGDSGAGRVVGWGFGVDRFLWFAAFSALVGIVVVRRQVWTPSVRDLGLDTSPAAQCFRRRASAGLRFCWIVLAVAGVVSIVFQSAAVSGLAFSAATKPAVVRQVLATTFGHLWVVQMVAIAVLGPPIWALSRRRAAPWGPTPWLVLSVVAIYTLAFASALNGHARTLDHAPIAVMSLASHLLAVGIWVGGLGALVVIGGPAWTRLEGEDRRRLLGIVVPRFSRVAIVGVAVVVASGTLNAYLGLAHVSDLWMVTYGRVVLAKVVLLVIALVLAARHLRVTPRRLGGADADRETSTFRRTSSAELVVLALVVALAAGLVALVPGRSLALQASGSVAQDHKAGGYTIQLFVDPARAGSNDIHITYANAQGLGAAEVTDATATVSASPGGDRGLDLRLISPGHLVATTTLVSGRYTVVVKAGAGGHGAASTFHLTIHAKG
jgi:copper transport protein